MKRLLPLYFHDYNGKLEKKMIEREPEKKGKHFYVAACDEKGNEMFGYCELCGKKRK